MWIIEGPASTFGTPGMGGPPPNARLAPVGELNPCSDLSGTEARRAFTAQFRHGRRQIDLALCGLALNAMILG